MSADIPSTFTVATTATGTVTVPYEINITKVETPTLADSAVAVYLTKGTIPTEEEVVAKKLMSEVVLDSNKSALRPTAYKLYDTSVAYENGTVKTGEETTTYNLRIWVDADANPETIKGQEYKIKVNVDSKVNAIGQ